MRMRNILRKDLYLINDYLQTALANSTRDVYGKGIYLIKVKQTK